MIADGLLGATGLAVGPRGEIYVAEIFAGRISRLAKSGPETVVELPTPSGLEYADGQLYVSYDVLPAPGSPPDGKVATIDVRR